MRLGPGGVERQRNCEVRKNARERELGSSCAALCVERALVGLGDWVDHYTSD